MKTKTTYYRIGQSLPPRHWYQHHVGWFGKACLGIFAVTVLVGSSYGYVMNKATVKSLSAQANKPAKLQKVTGTINTEAENIVDVQLILDKWAKEHLDETWSVTARSIEGPKFEAQLNQDKTYESASAKYLLMAIPLFQQIPAEQHKGIKLNSGKTMALCVNMMIRLSDQTCGTQVAEYLNYNKANAALREIGLTKTTLEPRAAHTTTEDMAVNLAKVYGNGLQKPARDAVMKSLREQRVRTGIPAACPGCVVSNVASEYGAVHDAAIVQYNGGIYVLSIFTKDGTIEQIHELAGKIQQEIIDTTSD